MAMPSMPPCQQQTQVSVTCRPNSGFSPSSVSQRLTNESLQVQPGTKWRALLLAPEATEWLHGLLLQLQRPNLDPPAQQLAAAAQALTVSCGPAS